jgi:hypothetical protein
MHETGMGTCQPVTVQHTCRQPAVALAGEGNLQGRFWCPFGFQLYTLQNAAVHEQASKAHHIMSSKGMCCG